ncbi:MAG: TPM domain-containing protein, partial [Betaproteobacteria bacterium]
LMNWKRTWRHLITDQRAARKLFPDRSLRNLAQATKHGEQLHRGQVRLAIEASLPLESVRHGMTPRQRAIEVFGLLRVWDTAANNGVLVYLLIADAAVEIVADRGIHAKVGDAEWQAICAKMETRFRAGGFADGVKTGLVEIGSLLALHFPRSGRDAAPTIDDNEMPDAPVIL